MTDPGALQSITEALGSEGLAKLEAAGERLVLEAGAVIVEPGDPLEHQFLILRGAVEVTFVLAGDVERLIGTLREGALLGVLAVAGLDTWRGRSRVSEPAELLRLPVGALQQLLDTDGELALRVLPAVVRQTGYQALIAVENLVASLHWNEQISGLSQLSFGDLIASPEEVTLRLTDGRALVGRLLRADLEAEGGYLALEDGERRLHIVRAAGIVSLERPPVTRAKE